MPVGVPKVPFRMPGEEDATWVDLYNRLYRQRLLFLGQEIDAEVSNQLVGLMVFLSIEDNTRDISLLINSPGGGIIAGISIYDTMQLVLADVYTICIGLAASMASFILVGGEIYKRIAFPHARVMIHQPASSRCEGTATDLFLEAEEMLRLRENLAEVYAERTGTPAWIIYEDMERDVFMSAAEAQAYGIVDFIGLENIEDFL
uniref:clp protease proteolytic subunit n=1 Tax=Hydrocharis chevalieri TaxID=2884936 RepID=UPI001F1448E7|nr:clp protease proteolytic subunit [Hydrocharis chevalieri]UKT61098.1 clp protease proteolytic subunit [Hydrocharis chevalieri]